MQLKIATLVVFFVFTLAMSVPVQAATDYPFVSSWGGQALTKTGAFTFPQYVAVDEAGTVYVTDLGNSRVQKFDNDGTYLHSWGSKGTGSTQFSSISGIAARNNYVYVVDHELNVVKKFDSAGNFIKSWGTDGKESERLKLPNGIAVSKDNYVYVADTANARIQKYDSDGKFIKTIGSSGTGQGQFLFPLGVAIDNDGNVYVSDSGNNRVQKFNSEGVFLKSSSTSSGGLKISPDGLAVDSVGNIIVTDSANNRILVMNKDGIVQTTFGSTGTANSQFKIPKGAALDSDGDLFVVDSSNHRIQKFGSKDTTETTQETPTEQITVKPVPNDFTKPTVLPPNDLYIEATGGLTTVSVGKAIAEDESGIKSLTNNAPTEFPLGITTIIWTAIDGAGNVGMATQTITVNDSTPPRITNLSEIVLEAKGSQNQVSLGNPTVTDLVGVLSITNDAPETYPLGETTVTWTAIDVAKNIATYSQKVTITDSTPPKVRAPANVSVEATSLNQNQVNLGEPSTSDNTEVSSITNDAPQFFPLGETEVVWTAVDVAGNVGTAIQKVIISDTTAPVISQPEEIVVEAISETSNPVTLVLPNVSDVQEVQITSDAPEFFPIGQSSITWTAVDLAGNNSTATQTVSVVDTTVPTLIPPQDITQEATGIAGNLVTLGEPTVEDITGISSISNNAPLEFPLGSTLVTWTATDNHGNNISANQTITIIDTTPPQITAPKDVQVEASGISENVVVLGEPKISDLVEIESITNDAPSAFTLGDTAVTWAATDTSGNVMTATQIVSVVDTTPPEVIVPQDLVVEATSSDGTSVSIGEATATDVIGVDSITNDSPNIFNLGTTAITWTATDTSGNTVAATQTVTIIDTTAPAITTPADITLEATSASDNTVSLSIPEATDSVSDVIVSNDAPNTFPLGETIVSWTATDDAGNSASATQKIIVVDTTAPIVVTPEDITVEATSKSDNTITLVVPEATDNVGVSSLTNDAPETFPVGETIVSWTATDDAGLSSTVQQKITIIDTTKPEIKVSDIAVEATSENNNAVDLGNVEATDLVDVASLTNDAPPAFSLGVTVITWAATDEAGNSVTATQTVTIEDTTVPTIIAPADVTVEAVSATDNAVSLTSPEATDSVSKVSITNDAPETFPLGETIVSWTATDSSGNISSVTSKVIVVDTTAPVITSPTDITIEATSADNNSVSLGEAEATDSVGVLSITNDAPETFPLGETIVSWTATDDAGNSASATQKIIVVDTTAPIVVTPEDITVEATSKSDNTITLVVPEATDNVGVSSLTNDAPETFPVGETIVSWTATDDAGNTQSVSQKVTLVDTVPPKFAKISEVVVEATSAINNQVSLGTPNVSDILDITSLTNDAPDAFVLGETIVTWTATDEVGNSATATQMVTVVDTTAPQLIIPQNIVVDAVSLDTSVPIGSATANDLTDVSPKITNDAPEIFPLGDTAITWTVVDQFGNIANQTQTVTVQACGKSVDSYNLIMGTEDDDVLAGTTFADLIFGLGGDDIISGEKGNDCIFAGDGEDIIYGNEGSDTINGEDDADIIKGGSGDDKLIGGLGNDIIDGGDDSDSCIVTPTDNDILLKCES